MDGGMIILQTMAGEGKFHEEATGVEGEEDGLLGRRCIYIPTCYK